MFVLYLGVLLVLLFLLLVLLPVVVVVGAQQREGRLLRHQAPAAGAAAVPSPLVRPWVAGARPRGRGHLFFNLEKQESAKQEGREDRLRKRLKRLTVLSSVR